jgi:Ca-activated chloride channel family protein
VEIQYQDNVHIDAGTYSLRFPMVVGPRYIPGGSIAEVSADLDQPAPEVGSGWAVGTDQVPDASRITPPVLRPGQGKINPVRIAIDFAPGFVTERVTSLYHPVSVTSG